MGVSGDPYSQGVQDERIRQQFADHDKRIAALETLMRDMTATVDRVAGTLQRFEASVDKREAIDEALLKHAEKASQRQVTSRQFWLGVGLVVCGLLTVLVGAGFHP